MGDTTDHPALEQLRARLDEEERAYAEVLSALDALSSFTLPQESVPGERERLARLNELWRAAERPAGRGLGGILRRRAWDALAPALQRQEAFNAALVQLLNSRIEETDRLHARLRELASALVRYAQRVQPLTDARARLGSAVATTRSELVLDAFGRQIESQRRRLDELAALGGRIEELARALQPDGPPGGPKANPPAR